MTSPVPNTPAEKPRRRTAWVTMIVLGITIAVFVFQYFAELTNKPDLLIAYGAKDNAAIMAGQIWRLITPVFLHLSFLHFAFNMYAFFAIGPTLERFYGSARFALVSFYLSPNSAAGASTAIFGLIAAQGVFVLRNREFFGGQARSLLRNTVMIVVVNLMIGLTPGIDNWGHVGGLLGGLAFAWAAGPLLSVKWLPGGGYTVVEEGSPRMAWVAAGIQFFVLVALVAIQVFHV
jgi:rhomboid protease GluP